MARQPTDELTVRPLDGPADFEACVSLQRETWGNDFRELVPPAVLLVSQKIGGVLLGASGPDGDLIGFVYGLTGVRDGSLVHWSHMLAVQNPWRDRGVGRLLKLHQRDAVRALGVTTMLWTFDPLVARNAHLNLNRLGTRVIEYVPNLYGENPMSRTDSTIGSDRFVVEWLLDLPTAPGTPLPAAVVLDVDTVTSTSALPDARRVGIMIPHDVQSLKSDNPARALAWRAMTRRALMHYLGLGYVVVGLTGHDTETPTYVLQAQTGA